jgi:hypothetical protein
MGMGRSLIKAGRNTVSQPPTPAHTLQSELGAKCCNEMRLIKPCRVGWAIWRYRARRSQTSWLPFLLRPDPKILRDHFKFTSKLASAAALVSDMTDKGCWKRGPKRHRNECGVGALILYRVPT